MKKYDKPIVEVKEFNLGNSNDSAICTSNTGTEDLGGGIYNQNKNTDNNGIFLNK